MQQNSMIPGGVLILLLHMKMSEVSKGQMSGKGVMLSHWGPVERREHCNQDMAHSTHRPPHYISHTDIHHQNKNNSSWCRGGQCLPFGKVSSVIRSSISIGISLNEHKQAKSHEKKNTSCVVVSHKMVDGESVCCIMYLRHLCQQWELFTDVWQRSRRISIDSTRFYCSAHD